MPELPEVETIRRRLAPRLTGKKIHRVRVRRGSRLLRDTVGEVALKKALEGDAIAALGRRGKYLLLALESGNFLVVHLGMTGALYLRPKNAKPPPHTHLRLEFEDAELMLVDPRTFGRVFLVRGGELDSHPALSKLGPEPLDRSFTARELGLALSRRKAPLKAALLDQRAVAGLGNIYADEACYRAGLSPLGPASRLSAGEVKKLHRAIRETLTEAIKFKGTTIRDYRWDAGRSGDFAKRLLVYGRAGLTCRRCGKAINRVVLQGRSAHFCPGCQGRVPKS